MLTCLIAAMAALIGFVAGVAATVLYCVAEADYPADVPQSQIPPPGGPRWAPPASRPDVALEGDPRLWRTFYRPIDQPD